MSNEKTKYSENTFINDAIEEADREQLTSAAVCAQIAIALELEELNKNLSALVRQGGCKW